MSATTPIRRLAIVNRGEAAMRCIRSVKALRDREGNRLQVIALYTSADRDAPFVRHADQALQLDSPNGPVAAYLDVDAMMDVLREAGADAVWPGWGFVAEDPNFVERLEAQGIRFLGPSAEAMRAVGDKIASKLLAESLDVPVAPWSGGAISEDEAIECAASLGYPLMLKASAGGGGRGIRALNSEADVLEAFRSASAEAKAAFGDDRLFLEKKIESPRHIEVQIAADLHGRVVALGCRDCSVQRRNQKLIEEAPPPGLSRKLRGALATAAVRITQAVSYSGVGTVEFLVRGKDFFFLEVNPRLQVEHAVTEQLTGIDLVALQIRIARGESLEGLHVEERGVVIEARVCAEDPDANFLPAPGRIAHFDPALGPGVRVDSGVAAGTTVPPDFDSLIAKVIASGEDREEARARLVSALRDFELVVEGGATNKGYLLEVLAADAYRAGGVDTGWLGRWQSERAELLIAGDDRSRDALVAAAIIAYQRDRRAARVNFYADPTAISPEHIPPSRGQEIDLAYEGESYRLTVYAIGSWRYRVHLGDRAVGASMREEGTHAARMVIDDRARRILYDATDLGLRVEVDGHPHRFGWQGAGQVYAGTPAMVVSVNVAPGDRVELGQALGLLEAMKMEIAFHAPVSGVVKEVRARRGQRVGAGEVLLVIDPAAGGDASERSTVRLVLPEQRDRLALLFHGTNGNPLAEPDLSAASLAEAKSRREAIRSLRDEIRRVLLGYDANPERGEGLVAFLEAPLPDDLGREFKQALAEIYKELTTFADVEQLFIRAPGAWVSGEPGPSNNARLRMYVRRLRASGAGIADEFLTLVRKALAHYGIADLTPTDALERAVLRLLASQHASELRRRLVQGVISLITRLAGAEVDLGKNEELKDALNRISRMRGLLPDALADAAIEADYVIFEGPGIERQAEQSSKNVESWLQAAENEPSPPPIDVLVEVASAPRRVFERVGHWISAPDPAQREIALAAKVQRLYAPRVPLGHIPVNIEGTSVHCLEYLDFGVVLAATASKKEVAVVADRLCEAALQIARDSSGSQAVALELFVQEAESERHDVTNLLHAFLGTRDLPCRFTLALGAEDGSEVYKSFEPGAGGPRLCGECHDLHPETAARIDLARLAAFDLERLPSEEGIYSFYGRSRDVRGDERVFVLADVRSSPLAGHEASLHMAAFEHAFHQATRSLRTILQVRDPRRRLQWNRIALFLAPRIILDSETASALTRRLAPATRHLGLEKVLVRLNLLKRGSPDEAAQSMEIVITDTGEQIDIAWRAPHRDPLEPAHDYERRVVEARRRRQVYPYEIIRMLTGDRGDAGNDQEALPSGSFEEFDLDPEARSRAMSVQGRPYGRNESGVVFGIISTPTEKVPEGMKRVLVLSDPTRGMGALAVPECDRLVAALDLAEQRGLPLEWVPVSAGAKIAMDSGTENLDATARVVRRIVTFTQRGGIIHLVVQGVNIGAQSYFDALATMLMHTRGVLIMTPGASMVLTGRAALEAAGAVAAEDEIAIGGFERIMGPNGQAQYYARNLPQAYRVLYDCYRYSYIVPGEACPRRFATTDPKGRSVCEDPIPEDQAADFAFVGEIFDPATNPDRKRPFPMRPVMSALCDRDGGQLERWRSMVGAETAIVRDAHLGGFPITLIGIESQPIPREGYRPLDGPEAWTGGTLFPLSSKKVARAINSASGNRPVVILANLSGFDGSPESLRKLQLEYGAEIARAVVNFEGPLLFLVVSRYHGGAYVVFSHELNDGLRASALTGSYASVIGGGPAAAVVFAREVRAQAVADPRVRERERALRFRPTREAREALDSTLEEVTLEKQAQLAEEFDRIHSVERAKKVGSLDSIVPPERMRSFLIEQLERAASAAKE